MAKPKALAPLAIASLALSCLGSLSSIYLVIPGIIFGIIARNQISEGKYSGDSLAKAGMVVGFVVGGLVLARKLIAMPWFNLFSHPYHEMEGTYFLVGGIMLFVVLVVFAYSVGSSDEDQKEAEDDGEK